MKIFDIAIIGAGPAGLMAAITATSKNKSVILLEKNKIIGRKLLATGNGRCNLTNQNIDVSRYHGANPKFISKILNQFDQFKVMKYFESLGVKLIEEDNGRIFPANGTASLIIKTLNDELLRAKVLIKTDCKVIDINHNAQNWQINLADNSIIKAKKIILTTGGKVASQFGSSGDGLAWAKKLGHTLTPIHSALVPLETVESWSKSISGLSIKGTAKIVANGKVLSEKNGDILFTHYGLSGPAIMRQTRVITALLTHKENKQKTGKIEIHIDIIPAETSKSLDQKIEKLFKYNGARPVKNVLSEFAPAKLIDIILNNLLIDANKKTAQISQKERLKIVQSLKNLILTVSKVRSLQEAQVTAGGIFADEINADTMQSKIISNLLFAGEIIDVDGDSGGFNLQWSWSSGYVAGLSASL